MSLQIFIPCDPPKATAQQQKTTVFAGKVRKYDPKNVRDAKEFLASVLASKAPATPFTGPLRFVLLYRYPWRKAEKKSVMQKHSSYPCDKRPDFDNIAKGLNDILQRLRYFEDDSQIADGRVIKEWGDQPGIGITIEPIDTENYEPACEGQQALFS
ncbi:MAG: RusA family crossover junction endodeoxyribonuclease [Verrucomicrobiota bacterium]